MNTKLQLLIIAEDYRLPYRVLRCSAALGAEVYIFGARSARQLRQSKFCKEFIDLGGSFNAFNPAMAEGLDTLCERIGIDYILPSCPLTTRLLAAHRASIRTPCYPLPTVAAFDTLNDKWKFATLCEEIGIAHPKTSYVSRRDDVVQAFARGAAARPLVLKPLDLWGSAGVVKLDGPSDIPASLAQIPGVLQQYIPGEEICAFYLSIDGTVRSSVRYRRDARGISFIQCPATDDSANKIIKYLSYTGVIGFDVKLDANGSPLFIECNPRFWYRMDLAALAGINFVQDGLDNNIMERKTPVTAVGNGFEVYRRMMARLFSPWRLTAQDLVLLRYLATDPVPAMMSLARYAFGRKLVANGAQL